MNYSARKFSTQLSNKEIVNRFLEIRTNKNDGKISPSKPLLLIWVISKCIQDIVEENSFDNRLIPFDYFKAEFEPNFKKYGLRLINPYWHLKNDNVWDLILPFDGGWKDPPPNEILKASVAGLYEHDYTTIRHNPDLGIEIIFQLLFRFLPNSIHENIFLDAKVPLIDFIEPSRPFEIYERRVRNNLFRQQVLPVYQYMCAVCNLSIQLYDNYPALEAAHIKAVKNDGPDKINNGLALCSNHHALFDSGAFTIAPHTKSFYIEVSNKIDRKHNDKWLMPYNKHQLVVPKDITHWPDSEFIEWHRENVFVK